MTLQDDDSIVTTLEPSDLWDNITAYAARISGEPRTHILPFQSTGDGRLAPALLLYNATYHGLCYSISLLLANGSTWTRPVKTVTLLTSKTALWIHVKNLYTLFFFFLPINTASMFSSEPLPLESVQISDYQPAPETGVVFELRSPERNSFSRVNISYSEGREQRFMLYKGQNLSTKTDTFNYHKNISIVVFLSNHFIQIFRKAKRFLSTGYQGRATVTSPSSSSLKPRSTKAP